MLKALLLLFLIIVLFPVLVSLGLISFTVILSLIQPLLIGTPILVVFYFLLFKLAKKDGMVWDAEEQRMVMGEDKIEEMRTKHNIEIDRDANVLGNADEIAARREAQLLDAVSKALN